MSHCSCRHLWQALLDNGCPCRIFFWGVGNDDAFLFANHGDWFSLGRPGTLSQKQRRIMRQLLLIPDPRPLDNQLGHRFFREAPRQPGVYLMRDAADRVLYVSKAKNLRQRLQNYRVANPDRMPRRHLRMAREVARIEFQYCPVELAALMRESKLFRLLKPKFNRAGVWPEKSRFSVWRQVEERLELAVTDLPETGWQHYGGMALK